MVHFPIAAHIGAGQYIFRALKAAIGARSKKLSVLSVCCGGQKNLDYL
jgi:hypothetical protein